MQIVITQGQLSDLFFNYDHATLASAYKQATGRKDYDGLTEGEVIEALTIDAKEFADCYGTHSDTTKEELAAWLVSDFMKRR